MHPVMQNQACALISLIGALLPLNSHFVYLGHRDTTLLTDSWKTPRCLLTSFPRRRARSF